MKKVKKTALAAGVLFLGLGILFILPFSLRLQFSNLIVFLLLLSLVAIILRSSFTIAEPFEIRLEVGGTPYHFPDVPKISSFFFDKPPPRFVGGYRYGESPVLLVNINSGLKHSFLVRLASDKQVFYKQEAPVGETLEIPSSLIKMYCPKNSAERVLIQVRGGLTRCD